ncbi:MAG: hypothetical protein AABY22_16545, partial [Nanoarchaeota archaeon]
MDLIKKLGEINVTYAMSGMSEQAISSIIAKDGVRNDYLEFLALERGRVYFKVLPKQAWDENTALLNEDVRLRDRFQKLKDIGAKKGLVTNLSYSGFKMYGSGDMPIDIATVHPRY